ncbi:MAG: tRNA (guanosine(37)-N1)-methyltransferase TrmD [Deltaproteobacteria bacterium]|nr:tRNA (guanosine(37)-N1)-methyltransferase TrmD [Deltaproteobacteria bacterium]
MRITVVTLFPELFGGFLETSLIGRAVASGELDVEFVQIRDYALDRRRSVDDTPYGGGAGMVLRADILASAVEATTRDRGAAHRVLLTPQGQRLEQPMVARLAQRQDLMLICGRYEGVDERFRERYVDEEISLGDFVLSGGEVGAMALIEAVARLQPGVMGNDRSAEDESFSMGGLEYPHYTRPRVFDGQEVPGDLLSGDHARIRAWRRRQSVLRTAERRQDLLEKMNLSEQEETLLRDQGLLPVVGFQTGQGYRRATREGADQKKMLTELKKRTYVALLHHPVYDTNRRVVATAVTNLDLHDIARSSRTYGVAGYFVVTPIERQVELVHRVVGHWTTGSGGSHNKPRREALSLLRVATSLEEVVRDVEARHGESPVVAMTSARAQDGLSVSVQDLPDWPGLVGRPLLLVFGTGWGLTESVLALANVRLLPIEGADGYNHLSVRSAVAIYLDRLFARAG